VRSNACELRRGCLADMVVTGCRIAAGSFDLHHLSSDQWECVAYQKVSTDPQTFNVQNGSVLAAYGYAM